MGICYGTRPSGEVDHVPGLFYVSTTFYFVGWFPLVPLRSHVVQDGSESTEKLTGWWEAEQRYTHHFEGVDIPLSWRSVAAGYLRAWCVGAGAFFAAFGLLGLLDPRAATHFPTLACLVKGGALLLAALAHDRLCRRPTVDRAIELARVVGLPREEVARAMGLAVGSMSVDQGPTDAE